MSRTRGTLTALASSEINGENRPRQRPGAVLTRAGRSDDDLLLVPRGDGVRVVAQAGEDLTGELAEQRRALDVGLELRELDRAADGQVGTPALLLHLDHGSALTQVGVLSDLLHGKHWRARHLPLAQDVHRLVLGLVGQPLL